MNEDCKTGSAEGTEEALRKLAKDKELWAAIWKDGADHLSIHFSDKAKKKVGGWLLLLAAGGIGAKLVVWLVQTGVIK